MQKPPNTDVAICPSTAFVDPKAFEIQGPKDNAAFISYATDMAKKYPVLKDSYTDLLTCWLHYHPKENK